MPNVKIGESKQKFLRRCTPMLIGEGRKSDQAYAICNSIWDDSKAGKAGLTDESNDFALDSFEVTLTADKDEDEGDGKKVVRKFSATAYAGQPVDRWFGQAIVDIATMDATKLSIPVLRGHDDDKIVGHSTNVWKDDTHFYVEGEVSNSTAHGLEVIGLADEGFPWQISIGIGGMTREILEDDSQTAEVNGMSVKGPIEIWRNAKVREISFLPFGADNRTAGIVMSNEDLRAAIDKKINKNKGEHKMKAELIEKLLKDSRYTFTDADRTVLEGLSDAVGEQMLVEPVDHSQDLADRDAQIVTLTATVETLKTELATATASLANEVDARIKMEIRTELVDNCVPGDLDKHIETLLSLKKTDETLYESVLQSLKDAGLALKTAGIFTEEGIESHKPAGFLKSKDAYDKLQDLKKTLMDSKPEMKEQDAWRQVIRENHSLYKEYNDLREKETRRVKDDDVE